MVEYDAIVVGSGISGGWAAKELTEKGLSVLVLERGEPLEHAKDYKGEHVPPWQAPFRGKPLRELYKQDYRVQSTSYAFTELTRDFWLNDRENPYDVDEENLFLWMRGGRVGGRSLMWGRQVYRWSDLDFEANKKDGNGIDWPIRYKDLEPWYSYVEKFIGVSGQSEGLAHLPDGVFQPPMEMNAGEKMVKRGIEQHYEDRIVTMGRAAVLTQPLEGRSACHYCGPCHRGCSTGSYFSSVSSTLPAAEKTGRLTLRANSVVESLEYDPLTKKVSAVRVIDAKTKQRFVIKSRLVFLCASTIASTQLLLNSRSDSFPNGLANNSGVLGHYLMDHTSGMGAFGILPGMEDRFYYGNRPNNIYIPRFRNLKSSANTESVDFVRGYGFQGAAFRLGWSASFKAPGFGVGLKERLRKPGTWAVFLAGFGETLPQHRNHMYLHPNKKDQYGIPQVSFKFSWHDNERRMRKDLSDQAVEMLKTAGASFAFAGDSIEDPGGAIHEMGTARMGHNPSDSVLNRWNQAHDVRNLFVTDGSAMTSSSCVNPSLTYMALTARACDYAARQLKEGVI